MALRAKAEVSAAALAHNVARLRGVAADRVQLCAVVKADGYGHGATLAAQTALRSGADWLGVATAEEAAALRSAGLRDARVLVLGALSAEELGVALQADADVVVWREEVLDRLPEAARVHVKLDTGMGRLGTRDPDEATRVADAAAHSGRLAGLMTHFATADDRADGFFAEQLARFTAWVTPLRERHPHALVHAANSAAALRDPAAHFDLIRPGVALYGLDPYGADPAEQDLRPVLRLASYVADVKACRAGESAGYGRRFVADDDTVLATVPIGYGDGWRRGLTNDADGIIRGRRFPLVGTVSMDNVTFDLGPDGGGVQRGDEVVLLGDGITAEEVARRLGTINYEVTCGLTPRVPRVAT
jgi:alanine racemase